MQGSGIGYSGAALLLIKPKMKTYLKYAYECNYNLYVAMLLLLLLLFMVYPAS